MKILKEYSRREFCKDIKCEAQKEIDGAPGSEKVYRRVKEARCKKCMAHVFHAWLNERGYKIAILGD